jgi:hypothetical protein
VTSNEKIVELITRHVLHDGEQVDRVKNWPDGVAVTTSVFRHLVAGSEQAAWTISREPWVNDIVLAERDDLIVEGQNQRFGFLLLDDGTDIYLNDQAAVSALGRRLADGMNPSGYAEILVAFHPYTSAFCAVLTESDELRRVLGRPDLPDVDPIRLQQAPDGVRLTFSSFARYRLVGAQELLDLLAWTVDVPAGEPARWTSRPTVTGLRLDPAGDVPQP